MRSRVQRWSPTSISEYTYGLCATIEIVDRIGGIDRLIAAPLVPSLQQEADLGFDLALEGRWLLLCLQFKIATQLVRGNAAEASVMGTPYFRFHVKTNETSNGQCQHNTLCDLEQLLSAAGEHVLYAAPIFDTHDDLSQYARSRMLVEHSVFVPPMRLGPVQAGDPHCFAYTTKHDIRPFSDPGQPFDGSFEGVIDRLFSTAGDRQPLAAFLESCDAKLAVVAERRRLTDLAPGRAAAFDALALDLQPIVIGLDVATDQGSSAERSHLGS